jgi:hypothetical protein
MVRKIQINISNKVFYAFVTLGVLIILSVATYAYGTFSPTVFGHSGGELDLGVNNIGYQVVRVSNTELTNVVWADCPPGKFVVGGGCNDYVTSNRLRTSTPREIVGGGGYNSWVCKWESIPPAANYLGAYAICVDAN